MKGIRALFLAIVLAGASVEAGFVGMPRYYGESTDVISRYVYKAYTAMFETWLVALGVMPSNNRLLIAKEIVLLGTLHRVWHYWFFDREKYLKMEWRYAETGYPRFWRNPMRLNIEDVGLDLGSMMLEIAGLYYEGQLCQATTIRAYGSASGFGKRLELLEKVLANAKKAIQVRFEYYDAIINKAFFSIFRWRKDLKMRKSAEVSAQYKQVRLALNKLKQDWAKLQSDDLSVEPAEISTELV